MKPLIVTLLKHRKEGYCPAAKSVLILFALLATACTSPLSAQSNRLIFTPHWLPQAQFAGYYMADQQGFYKDLGLEVVVKHPSATVNVRESLISGESDIVSLFLTTAVELTLEYPETRNIAQTSQHSALMIVSKKSKNIERIQDLNGKKIGIWSSGFDEIPHAIIDDFNLNVEWIPIHSTTALFLLDGVDAMVVMEYNEYDVLINAGIDPDELNVITFSECGYDIPEDGLYTLASTLATKEAAIEKFIAATAKGWNYAKAHPEESIDLVLSLMKKNHIPANRPHQRWVLKTVIESMEFSADGELITALKKDDFESAKEIIQREDGIELPIDYVTFTSTAK